MGDDLPTARSVNDADAVMKADAVKAKEQREAAE